MAKKKGGRPKGSIDGASRRVRWAIASLIDEDFTLAEMKRLINDIEVKNGPKAAFDCYVVLSDFVLPKLQRIEHTGKDGDSLSIEHVLSNLRAPSEAERLPMPDNSDIIDAQVITDDALSITNTEETNS